jgi:hypothetical protein
VTPRRLPAILVVAVALVGAAIVDRRKSSPTVTSAPARAVMAEAAPGNALSSTWYCQGASANGDGIANGAVIVANPTDRTVKGTVTFVASDANIPPKAVALELKPWSRAGFAYPEQLPAPWVSATVEVDGGGVVAEQSVSGPLGSDNAPCASSASSTWYFADGGTTRDAHLIYVLTNPFPEDAIVDLSFATDQGRVVPQALQGVVVPARGMLPVNVGEQVLRRRAVSATIRARTGRIAAARIQTYDGSDRRKGLTLVPATPSLGDTWYFPEGYLTDGMVERFQLYNPSRREARVTLSLTLEQGAAEPFDIVVPPQGRFTVNLNDETRIPKNVGHAVTVTSEDVEGIVVERSIDAGRPAPRQGLASTMGARTVARRWAFAAGLTGRSVDEWVVVQNPGGADVKVSFTALASGQPLPIDKLQGVAVKAGARLAVRLGDFVQRDDLGLLVTATGGSIVAERGIYRVGRLGMSLTNGIPLRD